MSRLKIILILLGAALILCLAVFAVAVVVLDNDDYRQLAIWSMERFTGYKVVIEGPFDVDLSMEPSLSAAGIRLEADVDGTPCECREVETNLMKYLKLSNFYLSGRLSYQRNQLIESL